MKLYDSLPVTLTYQNFGSAWLLIMRGPTEDIETCYNSLYNYCATNGNLEYPEQTKTVATIWTDTTNLKRYFANRYLASLNDPPRSVRKSIAMGENADCNFYVSSRIEQLQDNHEFFKQFNHCAPDAYSNGSITAERPDDDFRDAVVNDAFKVKVEDKQKNAELVEN